jgi:hypothetical protein
MKQRLEVSLAICFLIPVMSCGGETSTSGDGSVDTARDETDDAPPVQDPITFVVRNGSSETVYLDWTFGGADTVEGARTTGGAWAPVSYWPPPCMVDCADHEPGDMGCCIACVPPPSVKELPAGEELRFTWDGGNVHEEDPEHCSCTCYWVVDVVPMGYRAEACVHRSFDCWTEPCEADDEGVYHDANVEGAAECFETIFDIPYPEAEVVIDIEL